ncbi:peptidase, partial [Bifidobacteriaceae bacterium NR003]
MTKSNSRKHARKVTLDAAVNNAIEKAVDARKVAAFTVGAAGVLAGAAFAFGATPAMAAETGAATEPTKAPVAAGDKAGADAGKSADGDADTKPEEKEADAKEADAKEADKNNQADANKETGDKAENTNKQAEQPVVKTEDKKSDEENQKQETNTVVGQDRDASTASEPKPQANNTINLSKDTKDNLPNMYAWGKSNNVYIEDGQNKSVTINFARPDDGYTITKVAIFPSDGNTVDNKKSRGFLEYYSDPNAKDEHKPYSGIYDFKVNTDGTATLTMSKLYRDGNLKSGESYSANRCIYLYGTDKDGKTVVLYKTNIVRAATLIPPKTAGSIVLQYDEKLNEDQIQAKLKQALDAPTEATGNKSIREQIKTASTATGVGGRTGANGAFVQTPDDPDKKIVITDNRAYDPSQVAKINTVTSKEGQPTTYVAGAQTLKTYLVSDLGYKSEPLALTVARYDTRIDKPVVDDVDINKLTPEQKTEIIRKLAHLNHVPQDKVTFNENGEAVINFDGVDSKDAPKIPLRELVLKKIAEKDISVPAADKAVFVTNPLAYSDAEIKSIKKAIYEANKGNQELGLSENDYENQISLSYLTGNLTATGDSNKGISNGQAENTITVKIKTDKAVAEFKSDVKARKLTKLPDIRKDYNVTWTTDKINGRASDEGLSWSEDHKTIIYRYDPTKAEEFDTNKILGLLKATPKDPSSGLRELTGGEAIDHEGADGKAKKSHVGYALKDDQPTTELSLGNMDGAYWKYSRPVDNSGVDLGDAESNAGKYSWDEDAKPVVVAAKQDKVYKARLFVLPYGLTMYRNIYMENGNQPWNTPKAINVIFVPQTNHKTSDLQKSIGEHKTETVEGKDVPTQHEYYNASDKVKSDYDDALKVAKALYEQVKNTKESDLTEKQKADIDNATIKLDKARKALDGADTNKDGLDKSIEANGKTAEGTTAETPGTVTTDRYKNVSNPDFLNDDGKPDTAKNEKAKAAKKAYDEALAEANKVKEDKNATQKAVDEAKAKLDEARKKLNDFTTNKDELNNAIAQHGKVNTGDADKQGEAKLKTADPTYQNSTKEERDAYDKAVAEADKVSKDPNASQKEVNEAIKKLKDAKDALDKNATDKAPLDAAVQKSFDNPDPTKPDKQSVFYKNAAAKKDTDPDAKKAVEDYDKALAEAKRVLGDKNATKADVDKAKKDLEDAEAA